MNQIHEVLWCSLHIVSNRKVEVVADMVATYQHCSTYEFDSSISQVRALGTHKQNIMFYSAMQGWQVAYFCFQGTGVGGWVGCVGGDDALF